MATFCPQVILAGHFDTASTKAMLQVVHQASLPYKVRRLSTEINRSYGGAVLHAVILAPQSKFVRLCKRSLRERSHIT